MNEPEPLEADVRLAQKGDPAALGRVIESSQDRLLRFCRYLAGNEEQARDLCQEALVNALENLKSLKNPSSFMGWLFKAAKNLHLNHVKSPRNAAYTPIEDISTAAELTDRDLAMHIQSALKELDPEDRALLLLVDLEENTYAEAAEIMVISESDVRNRLHRIRKIFAKKIS